MKILLSLSLTIFLNVFSYKVIGQSNLEIADQKDFFITLKTPEGNDDPSQPKITIKARFSQATNDYTLQVLGKGDTFKLSNPLNHSELAEKITSAYNGSSNEIRAISQIDIERIFLWLYTLNQDQNAPTAGHLHLGQIVKIMNKNSGNSKERADNILRENALYHDVLSVKNSYRRAIDTLISRVQPVSGELFASVIPKIIDEDINPGEDSDFLFHFHTLICKRKDHFEEKYFKNIEASIAKRNELKNIKRKIEILNNYLKEKEALLQQKKDDQELNSSNYENDQAEINNDLDSLKKYKELLEQTLIDIDSIQNLLAPPQKLPSFNYSIQASEAFKHEFRDSTSRDLYFVLMNYFKSKETYKTVADKLKSDYQIIDNVSLQFEKGFLERIQVVVKENGYTKTFENIYAIGFSSIDNYKDFDAIRLFIRRKAHLSDNEHIYLSDVLINYQNLLDLYTRDYSPGDTVINDIKPEQKIVTLRKERNIKLFDSKIFSDLQGINENVPNGLIQIEVSRRFNIETFRMPLGARTNFNLFGSLLVYASINKIENKFKELPLRNKNIETNGIITSPSVATNLDLRQFENASIGLDYNPFFFDYPDLKFTTYWDFGLRYGHIRMVDSLIHVLNGEVSKADNPQYFSGHTITFQPIKLRVEFFSERRVGFNLAYNLNHTYALTNNKFKQIMSYDKSNWNSRVTERAARNSHMAEIFLRVETNREGNGQFFLRSRFFWQKGDANTFFAQTQFGYAYNIIFRK